MSGRGGDIPSADVCAGRSRREVGEKQSRRRRNDTNRTGATWCSVVRALLTDVEQHHLDGCGGGSHWRSAGRSRNRIKGSSLEKSRDAECLILAQGGEGDQCLSGGCCCSPDGTAVAPYSTQPKYEGKFSLSLSARRFLRMVKIFHHPPGPGRAVCRGDGRDGG